MVNGTLTQVRDDTRNYKYRRFISQLIAASLQSLLSLNVGIMYTFPTIVIAALTNVRNEHNQNEFLSLTAVQASYLGATGYIFKIIGCLLSGIVTDPLGRKRSMILANIPIAIGWFLLFRATTITEVFAGIIFHGISVGLTEAPISIYLGEISEPSYRDILLVFTTIYVSFGPFLLYLLNTLMPWRSLCLVCLTVPFITAFGLLFIPESPAWLLSRNRYTDAEKSLCWVRGWVSSETVAQEFDDLKRYSNRSKSCTSCLKQDLNCTHPLPSLREKLAELKRKQTLKPLFIVTSMLVLSTFATLVSMKSYLMQILKAYKSPIAPDKVATYMSAFEMTGNVTLLLLIRFTGKRKLYLFCLSGTVLCYATITWFGYTFLPLGYTSFDQISRDQFQLENKALGYIPLSCMMIINSFAFMVILRIPWILLSEIFSFKSRGIANGLTPTAFYLFIFVNNITYYKLETTISLAGVSLLYTCICFFGLILIYNILPETQNRTLEDIELHFSDSSKRITDRKIAVSKNQFKIEVLQNTIN